MNIGISRQSTFNTACGLFKGGTLALIWLLSGCVQIPPDETPSLSIGAQFKEPLADWMATAPADLLERGPWWSLFNDPGLNILAPQIALSNQNVAAAAAGVAQSQALAREQRAGLFPIVSASAGANRGGGEQTGAFTSNSFKLGLGASWEADVWGRVGASVSGAQARAQASTADLHAAQLSAEASLANNYLSLREADAEIILLQATITGYQRALQITENRYAAAIAPKSDVLQARTQLASAQAELSALRQQRAQFAHAMATLVGQTPALFELPAGDWQASAVPAIPIAIPSELLQRRPDIAAAARRVSAANADIGVARAAFFPTLTLNASGGPNSAQLKDLLKASMTTWSFGLAVAETIFDAGARGARLDAARAAWRQTVAQYRQTVLSAFQEVEDQLGAAEALAQQQILRRAASTAADETEQQTLNRYRQGQLGYTDVVNAQATALNARRAVLQISLARQTASISMITALGGGWSANQSEPSPIP